MHGVIGRCGQACAQCSGVRQGCTVSLRQRGGVAVSHHHARWPLNDDQLARCVVTPAVHVETRTPANLLAGVFLIYR